MTSPSADTMERARALRSAVVWASNEAVEIIAQALTDVQEEARREAATEIERLRAERDDLLHGRQNVIPHTREHANALYTIAAACLKTYGVDIEGRLFRAERDKERLVEALRPWAEAYRKHYDPGVSDLDNEQPIAWHVPLGAYRLASALHKELTDAKG